jgi:hypothetical protein
MKIFFTGSPRALKDPQHKQEHIAIYKSLEKLGHTHLSDLVISADPDMFYDQSHAKVMEHYNKTLNSLKRADVLVVESSLHSMSMGYLVEKALGMNKPVIVFYIPKHPPFFFSGIEDEKLQIIEYTIESIDEIAEKAIDYALSQQEVRFNFFISPAIGRYLDWISKVKKIPRSVYLRALIENEMRENKEYRDK